MATPVTFNGASYTVPAYGDTGWAQGAGNLSSYLVAIAGGTLQTTGGTFTLSAEAYFGAAYGLKSVYFKTATASPSTTGVLRLASADAIGWLNNAGGADILLSKDTSDRLKWGADFLLTTTAGVVPVTSGGTGLATLTAHGVLVGEGTSNIAVTAAGSAGAPLLSGGPSADPAFGALALGGGATVVSGQLPVANGGTGAATLTAHGVLLGEGTSAIAATTAGTTGQALVSGGASADPAFATLGVAGGGTGAVTLTSHGVLVGSGTSAVAATAAGTSGQPLLSGGASADPAYGTLGVAAGGTGDTSLTAYAVLCGGTTTTGAVQSVAAVGSSGQVLTSNGAGALPTFQAAPGAAAVATRQVLTSGSAATYTTPASVRQLRIRYVGGGGGGAGAGTTTIVAGTQGGTTIFNSVNAIGGAGGSASNMTGGYASTPGTGTASFRTIGNAGGSGGTLYNGTIYASGNGGGSAFGGGAPGTAGPNVAGTSATANSGAGGSGGSDGVGNASIGGGGQAGEYVELIINSPAASYTYTIGAGGAGGVSTRSGGAGGSGVIIVDELY